MREIGASWTRSLRPKITDRRRSLRKAQRWSARLEVALEQRRPGRPRPPWPCRSPAGRAPAPPRRRRSRRSSRGRVKASLAQRLGEDHRRPCRPPRPDAQPALQTRTGAWSAVASRSAGSDVLAPGSSHAGGSRKNAVTLIRIVLKSGANSSGCTSRWSRYAVVGRRRRRRPSASGRAARARALVAGEVEAAGLLEVVQEDVERGVAAHGASPTTGAAPSRARRTASRARSEGLAREPASGSKSRRGTRGGWPAGPPPRPGRPRAPARPGGARRSRARARRPGGPRRGRRGGRRCAACRRGAPPRGPGPGPCRRPA